MPRVSRSPVAVAFALYKVWTQIPPAQRRQVLDLARRHGPAVTAQARRHGPSMVRAAARGRRPGT